MLEAYALKTGTNPLLALRAIVGLTGDNAASRTCWIDLAYLGTWKGHADGEFTLDREAFESCIAAFKAQATPISLDYEHASLMADGQPKPAAGYVQDLQVRGDHLYALVELTERAAALVKAGEYRFCSGVFAFNAADPKSGDPHPCVLDSIALTNRPFIDGQKPIALTRSTIPMSKISREAIESGLDQLDGKEFTPEQLAALIEALAKMAEAQEGEKAEEPAAAPAAAAAPETPAALAVPPPSPAAAPPGASLAEPPPPPGDATESGASMFFASLMEATGLDEAGLLAALDANKDAIVSMLSSGSSDISAAARSPLVTALSAQLAEAKAKLKGYEDKEAAAEAATLDAQADADVDAVIAAGKILPAQKATWRSLARADRPRFVELTKDLPAVVKLGREASAIPAPLEKTLDVLDEKDPRIVEHVAALNRAGVKDPAIRKKHLTAVINGKPA